MEPKAVCMYQQSHSLAPVLWLRNVYADITGLGPGLQAGIPCSACRRAVLPEGALPSSPTAGSSAPSVLVPHLEHQMEKGESWVLGLPRAKVMSDIKPRVGSLAISIKEHARSSQTLAQAPKARWVGESEGCSSHR